MTRNETERRELEILLHNLWGKAVGTPEYVKNEWKRMQQLIEGFAGQAPRPVVKEVERPRQTAWERLSDPFDTI
jgi:hypothetical protein